MSKFIVAVAVCVVLLAASAMFIGVRKDASLKPALPAGSLAKFVPMQSGKWTGKDIPLGQTEEVERASENILRVTEFLSRNYKSADGREFTLYISYWAAGKETVVKASSHIPDNCWVLNGWKNINEKKRDGVAFKVDGKTLKDAYYREFDYIAADKSKTHRNVYYWYIVDGKPYRYGSGDTAIPGPKQYIQNLVKQCLDGIPEQFFIRLDTSENIETLVSDADLKPILKGLGELVLFDNANPEK